MSPLPIIVIDDDPGTRETLSDILPLWGYSPLPFEKGKEAIQDYVKNPVGVLLTDIKLPDVSGLQVLQAVREINPDAAVVIMTGNATLENAVQAINRGANAYVLKPLNMDELRAILKRVYREVHLSQENRRLIDRLQLTNRDLERAKREIEETNANLSSLAEEMEDLLHIVTHDLKAPLINIQGFSGRLKDELVSLREKVKGLVPPAMITSFEEAEAQSFHFIEKGVWKMDQMIQGLLRLSRVGRVSNPYEMNDLNTMVDDVRGFFSHQLTEKGIELVVHPLPQVRCRKNEINQVFSNLIANAINYMGDGPRRKIEVACLSEEGYFRFSVQDTGIGIEEKDFEKIFKLFTRLEEIPTPGEGIGLTIVSKIVRGHGGRIWVQAKKGEGSTFFFTLPKEDERDSKSG